MQRGTKIGSLFGIPVLIHKSWWFVFALLTWVLATTYYPQDSILPGQSTALYWILGGASALLLFLSVLLHELSHSLVARWRHIKVDSITLFFFGGVSGITKEDIKPSSEFMMAIAGPLFSFVLAAVFYGLTFLSLAPSLYALSLYLAQLNLVLGIFNLLPGFPLDGGRAFRAILRAYYKDLRKATQIAVKGGKLVAFLLIALGIFAMFNGGGGIWFIIIGFFLWYVAGASLQHVELNEVLKQYTVNDFVQTKYPSVLPSMTFQHFVTKYANSNYNTFLVKGPSFVGVLDVTRLNKIAPSLQQKLQLKRLSLPVHQLKTVSVHDAAHLALQKCLKQNLELLPVMQGKKVVGIIWRDQLLHRVQWDAQFGL